jgi:hypothetical protein
LRDAWHGVALVTKVTVFQQAKLPNCTKEVFSTFLSFNMVCTNVTTENLTNDILTDLYDELGYVIVCLAITAAIEVIGNGLLVIIIMYEKFGMDPQKRTTINQLLSKVCWMLIMTNGTIFPFMAIRSLFGPQSELVGSWILHGMTFSIMFNLFTLTVMMMLKCLYMFFWPRMAMLDDTFVAQFIGRFNVMISSICTFTRMYLGDENTNTHFQFATGSKFFKEESDLTKKAHFMYALLKF